MTTNTETTPTPWYTDEPTGNEVPPSKVAVLAGNREYICSASPANAAFLVHAANHHEDLRAALELMLPLADIGLRHLRATNNAQALQATNDLDDARRILSESAT